LDSVDGMSRALPHSNEAAKSARSVGESMQHELGVTIVFLTVTFDDENSLAMQTLSFVTTRVPASYAPQTSEAYT
jgi:hypothetical protein